MNDPRFRLTSEQAAELVAQFGTPLYVLDEATLRERMRAYRNAFQGRLSFAAKANPISAILAIAHSEGFGIDVASEGEFRSALHGGVPARECTFHGNNKTLAELQFAVQQGIGEIVADNFEELDKLTKLEIGDTRVLLRLAPGVDPITHEKISTGQEDTKFGFSISGGDAESALKFCLDHNLPLVGIHCHVGSQLLEPSAQVAGGEALARFAAKMFAKYGWRCELLVVGGGLGVRYTVEEALPIGEYCAAIVDAVQPILQAAGLNPVLAQEPGRSLVAEAGVSLFTVGAVKVAAGRRYVVVDGGLAENPRPALYGAEYAVERVFSPRGKVSASREGEIPARVSGKHCETDTLIEETLLPTDLQPGDVLQMLTTGAYTSSMASNYNRYPRPATVLIRQLRTGANHPATSCHAVVIQRAETQDELLAREQVPADLLQTRGTE